MSTSGIKRSTALIAAVLGGQTLALSIMLGAAWMLNTFGDSASAVDPNGADCVAAAAEAPVSTVKSRQLLDLSVGWLR